MTSENERREIEAGENMGRISSMDQKVHSGSADPAVKGILDEIEKGFHSEKNPEVLLEAILRSLCSYYQAEWAGVVYVDLEMGKMKPYYWYHAGKGSMGETLFSEQTFSEEMRRWVKALENDQTVTTIDIGKIRKKFPGEYDFYCDLNIRSVIAAPFYRGSTGFLAVKNPEANIYDTALLRLVSQTAAGEAREKKRRESHGNFERPEDMREDTDVFIDVLGGVRIVTAFGVIPSSMLNRKIMEKVIRLLVLKNRPMSSYELAGMLEGFGDIEKRANNLRFNISKFRKSCSEIFDGKIDLIVTENSGYCLNPELNIITDISRLEMYSRQARATNDPERKEELLKMAVRLYKGDILPSSICNSDLFGETQYYKRIYHNIVGELCELLAEKEDYETMHHFVTRAFHYGQHELILYFYGIKALHHKKSGNSARDMLRAAENNLDDMHFQELVKKVRDEISPHYCAQYPPGQQIFNLEST